MKTTRLLARMAFPAALIVAVPAIAESAPPSLKRATAWACKHQGERQRLQVKRIGKIEAVAGGGGRIIGAQTTMRVNRGSRYYDVRCNYSPGDRIARLTAIGDDRTLL